jgi:NitT/TauT family transport system substrate-binding protein
VVGPLWAALEAGLWQKYGLDVDLMLISGTPNSVAALLAGEVTFIQNSADAALSAQAQEPNLVAVANTSAGSAHRLIVGPGIERFEDVRGKRFGVFSHGDGNYALMSKALLKYGYEPDRDVIWTPVGGGNFAGLVAALASGAIDATLLTPPNDLVAIRNGGKAILSYADLGLPYAGLPVYTLRPTMERQRPVVEAYVAGLVEGARLFKSDPVLAKDLLARWTNLTDPEMLDWTYEAYRGERVADRPFLDVEQTRAVMETLASEQPDLRAIAFDRAYDNSILTDLERKGFFERH